MKNVIFLNKRQYQALIDAGIGMSELATDRIKSVLSVEDYYDIRNAAKRLLESGQLLSRLGFLKSDFKEVEYPPPYLDSDEHIQYNANRTEVGAFYIEDDALILWEAPEVSDTNNMLQHNLRTIVAAFSKVMSTADVVRTKQFELLILNKS